MTALLSSVGCAPPPGAELKQTQKVMEKERTADKLFERGRGFAAVGDETRAEQYLTAAVDAGYDEKKVMAVLLPTLVQAQAYRLAVERCEGYLKRHPEDAKARFVLATLYSAIGESIQANDELERLVRERPDNAEAHFALAVIKRDDRGDLLGADQHFREYLRLQPQGPHADEARGSLLKSVSP